MTAAGSSHEPEGAVDDFPPSCRFCGASMTWEDCGLCDEGYTPAGLLHECEPDWYDEDDIEPCEQCEAKGGWWSCTDRACSIARLDAKTARFRAAPGPAEHAETDL